MTRMAATSTRTTCTPARAAAAAVADTGIPAKLYLTAMRISDWAKLWTALREAGVDVPDRGDFPEETRRQMEAAEARITTTVDIRPVLSRKQAALLSHASQINDSWFSKIPPERRGAGVRPGELHPGGGPHRCPGPRG